MGSASAVATAPASKPQGSSPFTLFRRRRDDQPPVTQGSAVAAVAAEPSNAMFAPLEKSLSTNSLLVPPALLPAQDQPSKPRSRIGQRRSRGLSSGASFPGDSSISPSIPTVYSPIPEFYSPSPTPSHLGSAGPMSPTLPSGAGLSLSPLLYSQPMPSHYGSLLDDEIGLIFGVSIEESVARAGKHGVPDIVLACIEHLELYGLSLEGIYRVPGSVRRAREWAEKFEQAARFSVIDISAPAVDGLPPSTKGPSVFFDGESSSTVSKFYIPIKPHEVAPQVAVGPLRSALLKHLPTKCHLRTARAYLLHLNKVTTMAHINKMTAQNLSIVTFPSGGSGAEMIIAWARDIFAGWLDDPPPVIDIETASLVSGLTTDADQGLTQLITPAEHVSQRPPAWAMERPGEYSERAYDFVKEEATRKAHVEALLRAGLVAPLVSGEAAGSGSTDPAEDPTMPSVGTMALNALPKSV
ncbi:hypothetical protein HK405_003760 [Cladochytrium tenue]|nr:hypothetical protein HK405_003760 [Cladochytrium tenue]